MTGTAYQERRVTGKLARVWWSLKTPGRWDRFNRWRKSPAQVTKGYLVFRDFVVLAFVAMIVIAGVTTVRSLRDDDCRSANARRAEIEHEILRLVDNDVNVVLAADAASTTGLSDKFMLPLLERYAGQKRDIEMAYRPTDCPGPDL